MKSLGFFIIMSASLHCYSQVDEVFTKIFLSKKQIYAVKSNHLNETKLLKEFKRDITSLVVYENYLFVSLKRDHWYSSNNIIWRANVTDLKNFEVDPKSWDEFHVMKNRFDSIICMVGAKGYVYAGLSDGTIIRCSAQEKNKCEKFQKLHGYFRLPPYFYKTGTMTGIDYNPVDGKIYVTSERLLYSCIPETVNSCLWIRLHYSIKQISTLKVAFDSIWLATRKEYQPDPKDNKTIEKVWLMKCPTWKATTGFGNENDCQRFAEHPKGKLINTIDATERFLYYNLRGSKKMYRCDPKDNSSCFSPVPKLAVSDDNFIIM